LKSSEQFYASVYAKADVKRKQIKARNKRIRNMSASAAFALVLAVVAVPISRTLQDAPVIQPPYVEGYRDPTQTQTVPMTEQRDVVQPTRSTPRMVAVDPVANNVVMLNNDEEREAFFSELRCEHEGLPVMPAFEGAVTLYSAEELEEFIAELPVGMRALISDYDDAFFAAHNLNAMPMSVGLPEEFTVDVIEPCGEEDCDCDYDYEYSGGEPGDGPARIASAAGTTRMYLILLVPMDR